LANRCTHSAQLERRAIPIESARWKVDGREKLARAQFGKFCGYSPERAKIVAAIPAIPMATHQVGFACQGLLLWMMYALQIGQHSASS